MKIPKPKQKIAICGMHPVSLPFAPINDPEWEIWRINEAYIRDEWSGRKTKVDRWFQLHQRWDFTRKINRSDPAHFKWLQLEHDFPIFMQEKYDDIPCSVKFPLDKIIKYFELDTQTTYFTNSLALTAAYAAYLEVEEIGVFGWELSSETERMFERPSALYWLGIATGRGIKITIPAISRLMGHGSRIYAFDDVPAVNRMHVESLRNKTNNELYRLAAQVRNNPESLDVSKWKEDGICLAGMISAYEVLLDELADVEDPRGVRKEVPEND